jgi:ketosteroid isomerase-like protein
MSVSEQPAINSATLKAILEAFNRHDLESILHFFAEECVLEMPRGQDPWGQRFVGKAQVRDGLASRFAGIPDVHYSDDRHCVCGDRGVSEWLLTGTTTAGVPVRVRGCDLWEFRDGKVSRKDSYWKIVQS